MRRVFFFDLDDTLHDASHAIFNTIDARMTDYVARYLAVEPPTANQLRLTYWRRYGATMLGLMRHHAVDPHHFLRETHDFDVVDLLQAERGLTRLFAALPGRKVLLTNAPDNYAAAVLRALSLHRKIGARYAIERMRVFRDFRPKPALSMLRQMLARERLSGRQNAGRAVLIEDSQANLKAARAAGFSTVLITGHQNARARAFGRAGKRPAVSAAGVALSVAGVVPPSVDPASVNVTAARSVGAKSRVRGRAPYVDLRLRSVRDLPRALRFLR